MQDVGDVAAERLEPAVLAAARLALGEHQRVVLVHRQQALAAAGRAEHGDAQRGRAARRGPLARMRASAITAAWRVSAPSSREITAAMSRPARPSASSAAATCGSFAQARAERMGILGLVDLVAERDRLAGAQPQQVARRQRADDAPGLVDDAEMADLQPAHAADGAIDERVGRHRRRAACS